MTKSATATTTHEQFIHAVRDLVLADAKGRVDESSLERLAHAKLLYGVGDGRTRGVTIYQVWENGVGKVDVIEIHATGEESWVQLAGTVIHELGHVLTGHGHGHDVTWKDSAKALGFTKRPEAAGQVYRLALIRPTLRYAIAELARQIADGGPAFYGTGGLGAMAITFVPRPCSAGVGVKGGKSRGKGSGSRMRLYECSCERPVKVRVASDTFAAHCDECGASFELVTKS
jgi:hypothetical protein